jgi:hypothetical protein
MPVETVSARTATVERQDDMIADVNSANGRSNLLDDARPFMSEDNRPLAGKVAFTEQEVGMADPRTGNLYENLADPDLR